MAKQLPYTNPDYVYELTGETVTLAHCDFATAIIDQHMGQGSRSVYQNGTLTLRYSGDGGQWLDLGYYPVTNVASVYYVDGGGNLTLLDPSKYLTPSQHNEADGYLYNPDGWAMGPAAGNVQVTFTYGEQGQLMELVRNVASQIAAFIKRDMAVSNIKSETIGTYSVSYVHDIPRVGRNGEFITNIQLQLALLPKHQSITAVGQEPDTTLEGVGKTMMEDTFLYNSGWSNF